jgi:hypothetical protein
MPIVGSVIKSPSALGLASYLAGRYSTEISKGIKEPASPYRQIYYFGLPWQNLPFPTNWNALPVAWDPTRVFDLSMLPTMVELGIVFSNLYGCSGGTYLARWKFYRDTDNVLLQDVSIGATVPAGYDVSFWAIFGYFLDEICQNGLHHIDIEISGPDSMSLRVDFSATGIPVAPTPPVPSADWIDRLVHWAASLSNTMASWAATASGWVWPLNIIAPLIIFLSTITDGIFGALFDFRLWLRPFLEKVGQFLNWDEIKAKLQDFLDMVAHLWDWFQNKLEYVKGIIGDWWEPVRTTVLGWIATATQGLTGLLVAWDNFRKVTLPGLIDATWLGEWWRSRLIDVGDLVNSKLKEWFPFYDDLAQVMPAMKALFANPFDWLLEHFTDWFLGKE